jgi:hypothetical protein
LAHRVDTLDVDERFTPRAGGLAVLNAAGDVAKTWSAVWRVAVVIQRQEARCISRRPDGGFADDLSVDAKSQKLPSTDAASSGSLGRSTLSASGVPIPVEFSIR